MSRFQKYLITAALPYANGPLHIGHIAGAYLPADIFTRFLRMFDKEVLYVCGSDEHGAAITMKAQRENKSPREIINTYHELFERSFQAMDISFDIYHRTSSELHHNTSQAFFEKLYEKNEFLEKESEQYYDEKSGMFLADRYIKGQCPKCHHPDAYGDQCENCGSSLSPTELIDPVSVLSGEKPILKTTRHWYLPLDKYADWLADYIEKGEINGKEHHIPDDWKNHVKGQCKSWIDGGLVPRAMTRDLDWGVDVPQVIPGSQGKKLYVWMDAPIGYISATKQWAFDNNKNWKDYWQNEDCALYHFIGKDNIVFHCLIFPAILNAHGGYNLPFNVPANQFLNLEEKKISTSRNWAIWIHEFVEELPDLIESLRYYLVKIMPEQRDSEFTWKGFQECHNNELVNNFSNFVNRVLVLTHKYFEGIVPTFDEDQSLIGAEGPEEPAFVETELLLLIDQIDDVRADLQNCEFRSALNRIMDISAKGNQILQANEPWKNIKEDEPWVRATLNLCLQYATALSLVIKPFLPKTAMRLCKMLNIPVWPENGEWVEANMDVAIGGAFLEFEHQIGKAEYLFSRIDDELIHKQIEKLRTMSREEESQENLCEEINYDEFSKMQLITATILSAEKVKKTDKLLHILLDTGSEKREVVSGIAQFFEPNKIIGQRVLYLANLTPRKIRGILSKGMILMAEKPDGALSFVAPPDDWPNGSPVK